MKTSNIVLKAGDKAPLFTLTDDNHHSVSLKDLLGKQVIIYFYPKDETPGCTREACDFRDMHEKFKQKNTVILGISKDSIDKHQKFKKNHELPFTLLSDETGEVCEKYGAWGEKQMMGKKYLGIIRSTFVIDKNGIISQAWYNVKVDGHVAEVLKNV